MDTRLGLADLIVSLLLLTLISDANKGRILFGFEATNNISISEPIIITLFLNDAVYQCPIHQPQLGAHNFYCNTSSTMTKQCDTRKINIHKNLQYAIHFEFSSIPMTKVFIIEKVFIIDYNQNDRLISIETFCIDNNNNCKQTVLIINHKSSNLMIDVDDPQWSYGYISSSTTTPTCFEGTSTVFDHI